MRGVRSKSDWEKALASLSCTPLSDSVTLVRCSWALKVCSKEDGSTYRYDDGLVTQTGDPDPALYAHLFGF